MAVVFWCKLVHLHIAKWDRIIQLTRASEDKYKFVIIPAKIIIILSIMTWYFYFENWYELLILIMFTIVFFFINLMFIHKIMEKIWKVIFLLLIEIPIMSMIVFLLYPCLFLWKMKRRCWNKGWFSCLISNNPKHSAKVDRALYQVDWSDAFIKAIEAQRSVTRQFYNYRNAEELRILRASLCIIQDWYK